MASSYDNAPGKIFIGGVSPTTTQDTIQKYFEQYGELCDCVLMQDKATGKSRCFGFVTYKDAKILDDVLSKKHLIDGKEIDCKQAIPRDQHPPDSGKESNYRTKKLFVGGLTQTTTEEQFRSYFEQFGAIEDSVIMVDKETGKSRGFGFVTFEAEESVDRVVDRFNDNKIDGKWVECKKAQAKDAMSGGSRRGGGGGGSKHGGGGGDRRDQGGRDQRYSRSGNSSQGGYYQTSPTSNHGGGRRSSRNPSSNDYSDSHHSRSHGSNSGRGSNYENSGPSGYNNPYDYSQSMGYDPSGYNARANPMGYDYAASGYPSGYGANYPNSYPYMSNPSYGGYAQQYGAAYGQPGFDQMGYGMPQTGANGSNPGTANPVTKGADSTIPSVNPTGANPNSQYAATNPGYAADGSYNPAGYNFNSGDYANGGAGAGNYMGYNNVPGQGGAQGSKYPSNQTQSTAPMGSYPKSGQSGIGPDKGGNKKAGVEQRYYEPY